MTQPIQPQFVAASPRFGRRAKASEVEEIRTAAAQANWDTRLLDPKLCFVQEESRIPLWKDLKRLWTRWVDGLRMRWTMFRQGLGMFPKVIARPVEVYTLRRYPSAEGAQGEFIQLKGVTQRLSAIKAQMIRKAEADRQYRDTIARNLEGVDSQELGLPAQWLNPFSLLKPITLPKVKVDIQGPLGPEHFLPSSQVERLSDTSLLLRTRLGPHSPDSLIAPPPSDAGEQVSLTEKV